MLRFHCRCTISDMENPPDIQLCDVGITFRRFFLDNGMSSGLYKVYTAQ